MPKSSLVLVTGVLFLLPGIEVAATPRPGAILRTPAFHIASFIPACEPVPPRVTSVYTGPGRPIARGRFMSVEVFMRGNQPTTSYTVVGEVTVSTRNRNISLWNLIDSAKSEARRLGGQALIDVWPRAVSADDPQGARVLTAKVVSWS